MNHINFNSFKFVWICILMMTFFTKVHADQSSMKLTENGHTFEDLNKNGRLDPYEDSRLDLDQRVADLLGQMTLDQKVGLMFSPIIGLNPDGSRVEDLSFYSQIGSTEAITKRHINHIGRLNMLVIL